MTSRVAWLRTVCWLAPAVLFAWAVAAQPDVTGSWPLAATQFRLDLTVIGVLVMPAAAWTAAATPRGFLRATAASTPRLLARLVLPAWAGAVLVAVVAGGLLVWQVTRVPAGGLPPWWLVPAGLCWLALCATAGTLIGLTLPGRASLRMAIAAVVGLALAAAATARPRTPWSPMFLFTWSGTEEFVRHRPEPAVLLVSMALAAALAGLALVAVARGAGPAVVSVGTVVALALSVPATALAAGSGPEAGVLRARPLPADPPCTPDHLGHRLCGWPEDAHQIDRLAARWPAVIDVAAAIGAPVPAGTIVPAGMEAMTPAPVLTVPTIDTAGHTVASIVETSALTAANAEAGVPHCEDPTAPGNAAWFAGYLAQRLLFPEERLITITLNGIEVSERTTAYLEHTPKDQVIADLRAFLEHDRTCDPSDGWATPPPLRAS